MDILRYLSLAGKISVDSSLSRTAGSTYYITYTVILREYVHASAGYWSYSGIQGYKLQPPFVLEQIRSVSQRNPMLHFPVQPSRKPGSYTFLLTEGTYHSLIQPTTSASVMVSPNTELMEVHHIYTYVSYKIFPCKLLRIFSTFYGEYYHSTPTTGIHHLSRRPRGASHSYGTHL